MSSAKAHTHTHTMKNKNQDQGQSESLGNGLAAVVMAVGELWAACAGCLMAWVTRQMMPPPKFLPELTFGFFTVLQNVLLEASSTHTPQMNYN